MLPIPFFLKVSFLCFHDSVLRFLFLRLFIKNTFNLVFFFNPLNVDLSQESIFNSFPVLNAPTQSHLYLWFCPLTIYEYSGCSKCISHLSIEPHTQILGDLPDVTIRMSTGNPTLFHLTQNSPFLFPLLNLLSPSFSQG